MSKGVEGRVKAGTYTSEIEGTLKCKGENRDPYILLSVTIAPTPPPEWDMNNNVKRLVNRARTLSKLRSNGEEDYEEEWAGIGRMVSAEAFKFGLHAGENTQEGSHD